MLVIGGTICPHDGISVQQVVHRPGTNLRPLRGYAVPMTESHSLTLHHLRTALSGAYDIEAPIGRGGMAFVYLARERRLDRPVAIKVLSPDLARDGASRKRFLREARTVAQLTHPNIVPIFTVDEIDGFVFFAMAYVDGETLAQRVATRGPLDPHQAGRLLCDVGEALDYAPARVAAIVDRCLAKEPWARFADAAALVRAIAEAVLPPPVPLAVRAFLVRSTHLEAPALIHALVTGVALLPATVAAWLSPAGGLLRAVATSALGVALALPAMVAVVRVRRLLAAGHRRAELVSALAARQARRREELAFVYGPSPTSFERGIGWLARVSLLATITGVRGPLGRARFRVADPGAGPDPRVATILGRLETPA